MCLLKKYNQKIDIVLKLSVTLKTIKKRILERKLHGEKIRRQRRNSDKKI